MICRLLYVRYNQYTYNGIQQYEFNRNQIESAPIKINDVVTFYLQMKRLIFTHFDLSQPII